VVSLCAESIVWSASVYDVPYFATVLKVLCILCGGTHKGPWNELWSDKPRLILVVLSAFDVLELIVNAPGLPFGGDVRFTCDCSSALMPFDEWRNDHLLRKRRSRFCCRVKSVGSQSAACKKSRLRGHCFFLDSLVQLGCRIRW